MQAESEALVSLGRALRRAEYEFVTVTPETHRRVNARLHRHGNHRAATLRDVFGWSLPFERELLPESLFEWLRVSGALEVTAEGFQAGVRFSTLDDLLLVHSAFPTRETDAVFFGPDTYRFCQLLRRWAPRAHRVVDIGCGTGAGGLCAASSAEHVVLSDINARALAFAEVNAALAGQSVSMVQSDVLASVVGELDLIIANPPYMRDASARTYRDGGGAYGEALSVRIVGDALQRLGGGGTLIVYTGAPIVDGVDRFRRGIEPHLTEHARHVTRVTYEELDPDVFGEELDQPEYAHVERIAAVGLKVEVSRRPT